MRANSETDVFKSIDMTGGKDACWPFTGGLASNGRPYHTIRGKKILAYRLVYKLVSGNDLPSETLLRHTCDNEICCNPAHLIPGTHEENMDDMKTRERHGLPHNTVRAIKRLIDMGGDTHASIARKYGISRQLVTDIANNRVYQHVKID